MTLWESCFGTNVPPGGRRRLALVMQKKIHPQMTKERKEDAKRFSTDRRGLAFDRN